MTTARASLPRFRFTAGSPPPVGNARASRARPLRSSAFLNFSLKFAIGLLLTPLLIPVRLAAQAINQSGASHANPDTLARRFVMHQVRAWEVFTDDFLIWDNRPNFTRGRISMNRWGMRGPDYPVNAPRGIYRIALLGSSMTLNIRVPLDHSFATLLEHHLNKAGPGVPGRKYEIMNFSGAAYAPLQNLALLDRKVRRFAPKAILVGVFSVDAGRTTDFLTQLVKTGYPIPYPYVAQRIRSSGATAGMEEPELRRRLGAISEDIVRWSYTQIVEGARRHGAAVVGLVLPEPRPRQRAKWKEDIDQSFKLAASAGLPLLDLRGVYAGQNVDSLRLGGAAGNDPHWNERGNRLIAERVFELMRQKDAQTLRLGLK